MDKNSPLSLTSNLEEVRDQFEEWRRTRKNRRDPIPARLWKTAVKLAGSNAIHSISKALRLNYSDPKERVDLQKFKAHRIMNFLGGCPFIKLTKIF